MADRPIPKVTKVPKRSVSDKASWTYQERFIQAKDFLRFLETEKIKLSDGITKNLAKKMYNKQYKAYREQVAPNAILIPYNWCLETLYNKNILHSVGTVLRMGPRPSLSPGERVKLERELQQNSEKQVNTIDKEDGGDEGGKSSSGRNRRPKKGKKKSGRGKKSGKADDKENEVDTGKAYVAARLQRLRFRRQWPVKVAVDQHLTFRRPETQDDDTSVSLVDDGVSANVTDKKYIKRVEDENLFACRVCHTTCTSKADVEQHLNGKVHRLSVVMDRLKSMR